MKSPHLQAGALLTACAAGQGAVVVVEGEHREDDEWFYGQWFGHLGPRISFFAQNGWAQVINAVVELRAQLRHRPVFGIVDGDFVDPSAGPPSAPGIHRLRRYSLENYLLEAEGWLGMIRLITRGSPPAGWASLEEVDQRLDDAYRHCLPLAAYNRTVFEENCRYPVERLAFLEHPEALSKRDPKAELDERGRTRSAPRPLSESFDEHLSRLQSSGRPVWHGEVTGKAVLKVFLRSLKVALKMQLTDEHCCSMFFAQQPRPHQDLVEIVEAILEVAGT